MQKQARGVLWVASRGLGRGTVELDTPACVGPGKGALVAVLVARSRCFGGLGGDGTRLDRAGAQGGH